MADESEEQSDSTPERSGQPPRDTGRKEPRRPSNRRRVIIASLLTPPAVMTLNARSARAQAKSGGMGGGMASGKGH